MERVLFYSSFFLTNDNSMNYSMTLGTSFEFDICCRSVVEYIYVYVNPMLDFYNDLVCFLVVSRNVPFNQLQLINYRD